MTQTREWVRIKKSTKLDPEYLAVLEEVIVSERSKAERHGRRGDLPWWRYDAPYTLQQVKLMVAISKQNSNNPKVYFRGMLDGWFVGYADKRHAWSGIRHWGYSYIDGRMEGSKLFHRMEDAAMFDPDAYPKYLGLDIDKQVNTYHMWHHPSWCDECKRLYREQRRILGRVDGDRIDATERMNYFSAKNYMKEFIIEFPFRREDPAKARDWDESWEYYFGKKPKKNPFRKN